MTHPNLFEIVEVKKAIARINNLTSETRPECGKMNVAQMLAHCCVPYEYEYMPEKYGPPATGIKRFLLRTFLKSTVAGSSPYKKNSRTAPDFMIVDEREFETEKQRLIDYLNRTQDLGVEHFVAKPTQSMGMFTADEWNTMFYKHLDYHLLQFGV